ncbi:MAG: urease accessory UreF family protein [Gammaproteobacteria bacterium]
MVNADPRLWQLISPALPVGGYSYSQGLELAVEQGVVSDEASAADWIGGLAAHAMVALDLPLLLRVHAAATAGDAAALAHWAVRLACARETAELRREDADMASALRRLLGTLAPECLLPDGRGGRSYPALFACAAAHFSIAAAAAAAGYLWAWCENQVAAATRLVPLGQSSAQRVLFALGARIPGWVEMAAGRADDDIGYSAPGAVIASARHEIQYTRLFRS